MKSKSTCNTLALKVIASNYDKLMKEIRFEKQQINTPTRDINDVFQDTILLISEDPKASLLKKEGEILELFKYRYNVMRYRTLMNYFDEMKQQTNFNNEKK